MTDLAPLPVVHGSENVVPGPSAVTIGNFDGVHAGHRLLLQRTVEAATARGVRSVAITFDPHPAAVLRPGSEPPRLCSLDERVARIVEEGIQLVVVLPFTETLSRMSPERFIETVLAGPLSAVLVVVGTNFRFGHKAAGHVATLEEVGRGSGFEVVSVDVKSAGGQPVSSTAIRAALHDGDVGWVTGALGRPFGLRGRVVQGDGRGRTIGVPTANVEVEDGQAMPGNGVYAGHAVIDGVQRPCVTNVGIRPTFDVGDTRTVEVHVIDVEGDLDLYGEPLEVTFEHRLRAERRFESVEELIVQIRSDIDLARLTLQETANGA